MALSFDDGNVTARQAGKNKPRCNNDYCCAVEECWCQLDGHADSVAGRTSEDAGARESGFDGGKRKSAPTI